MRRLRVLHAIHDFLPRHRAGSEIYALDLMRELARRHDVWLVTAEYDPAVPHGTIRWRTVEGLPVAEIVNNWEFAAFEDTYASARLNRQLAHVLDATGPDVLHVHNLLNLSFDLPRLARERGVPSVATLHDYTLVCASGGQRVHAAESFVCETIDTDRCARCFTESPFHSRLAVGRMARGPAGRRMIEAASALRRRLPMLTRAADYLPPAEIHAEDIQRRLAYARHVFEQVDGFVAPSAAIAAEYVRLGLDPERVEVSDYGFAPAERVPRAAAAHPRFGFVGTLAWHKGAHVFVEALKDLRGPWEAHVHGDPRVAPRYASDLERSAAGFPIRFPGGFDRSGLAGVYASVDVLVVPSLWPENSPLVVHEAFMHGVAVVAARMGGLPGLVTEGVNGLLYDAYNPADLRERLQRFVDDPGLAARLAAAAPAVKSIEDDAAGWAERYEAASATATARKADGKRSPVPASTEK